MSEKLRYSRTDLFTIDPNRPVEGVPSAHFETFGQLRIFTAIHGNPWEPISDILNNMVPNLGTADGYHASHAASRLRRTL